jgi:imidazolonepropionase-like amidohydrolase
MKESRQKHRRIATAGQSLSKRCAGAFIVLCSLGGGPLSSSALAQLARPIVLRDARLITMSGPVIEKGSIIIKAERIEQIGAEVDAPLLARTIKLGGKVITPGFIDAFSALGHTGGASSAKPLARAWDGFDHFARDDFREALRHGVTTVFVAPGTGSGINGIGVVARLVPRSRGSAGERVGEDTFLCINFGSHETAVARAKNYQEARKLFRKAMDYRQALEDYEEDLKEYVKKLEERKKKEEAAEKKDGGKDKSGDEKKPEKDEKKEEPPPEEKPKPDEPEPKGVFSAEAGQDAPLDLSALISAARDIDSAIDGEKDKPPVTDGSSGETKDSKGKKEDELKKPTKPAPDRVSELLLQAIDRKLAVRVLAHRSADVMNVVALAGEFNLDVVIDGGTEAYLMAEALSEAEIPVVLGPTTHSGVVGNDEFRRHSPRAAEILNQAGVDWTIASGATDAYAARFVALDAALATPPDDDAYAWMRKITVDAARILRIQSKTGALARGMQADLVVWSGDPNDPVSIVERVYIAGKLAYLAPHLGERGDGS